MSDQLYDEWSAACDKVRELDHENTALRNCIAALEAQVAKARDLLTGYMDGNGGLTELVIALEDNQQ